MTIFRAYDVRGIYRSELTEEMACQIGKAFGTHYEGGSVTLGRDTRDSGPSLEKAFLQGLLETGCQVFSYGVIPISILSFITWREGRAAAAYISASHNPPEYNGIRFRTSEGYGLLYQKTGMLDRLKARDFRTGKGSVAACSPQEAIQAYRQYVGERLKLAAGLKVVLDTGNGSSCGMERLYQDLGLETVVLNGSMDGRFPGRGPSPSEESLSEACRTVKDLGADFGVGFDPDADRGIIIDDRGRVVPPEKVAVILASRRYRSGDLVVSGFDCSMILEKELHPIGIRVRRERVGDVFVANTVKESGAVLGVERSGHFFLPEFQYSDDPFAMSLAIAQVISGGERLSRLADGIADFPYQQKGIRLPAGASTDQVMARLLEQLSDRNPDTTDGIKIVTDSYSVLIRPSNTEPLVRLYVETCGADLPVIMREYESLVIEALPA
ncbi:MAG: putative phosphoglucosamine mutase [Methanosaeta sp. PtaB.Bin039]|nr:MAG: putative phosphoglucosamine mutase [Methanosaeta sp. PtaB.Bin039]OPY47303.1 MAG: putative phosphoglucosamine mutase [Methanosaeta sp. PtaU1.Bin028]HOT07553.1 phosphoglucomutase [Methanotrichaceae archaeon]HQI53774.1 phosphoglucomutase [Methanothrix soehngenii]HQF16421.1 phosphoglucomutase [Methanotrichaceae archaeon]